MAVSSGMDHLTQTTFDPLLGEYQLRGVTSPKIKSTETEVDNYPLWDLKKAAVLTKYTTNKTIPVPYPINSFIFEF